MDRFDLSHLSDEELLRQTEELVEEERARSAAVREDIAELNRRGLTGGKVRAGASGTFEIELVLGPRTYERLLQAQALAAPEIPTANLGQVLERALDALISELE